MYIFQMVNALSIMNINLVFIVFCKGYLNAINDVF